MSSRLKGGPPSGVSSGDKAPLAESSKELLRTCLKSIHERTRRYYYDVSAEKSIPGCLSFLLGMTEADLGEILKICGFYNEKKGTFLWECFKMWVFASFDKGTVEATVYKKSQYIKIGTGTHPNKPAAQMKDNLQPPSFRMQTAEGKSSKDSLMGLFEKPPGTALFDTPPRTTTTATTETTTTTETTAAAATTTTETAAASPVKLAQRFNISSPDKSRLVMELVSEMATPEKVPVIRKLVKGATISVHTLNNQTKKYVHIPQCSSEASAMSQVAKYKFIQEIVDTLGAGAEKVADSLNDGALWLCRGLADLFTAEFVQSAARAGITCISRMSAQATGAMWTDAKLTKGKSRKISAHLFHWFKKPVTAKEPDVDAFGTRPQVKRKYDTYAFTSEKGKKQSEEDIKKRRRDIVIKYWVANPFEAVEDELISRIRATDNSKQPIVGFKFPLLDTLTIVTCFLADHGNIAWRAGLTIIANEQDGQGEPVKVAHLLGKDSYHVLCNTAQPILNEGLSYLQGSALLVIRNNVDAENNDDVQQECILVPRKAFINSYATPFQKFFMTEPVDQGDEHQKVLVDSSEWKSIEQSARLLYDPTTKEITGVSWQNINREEVKKEFRDGGSVTFSASSTLEMYPIVVLGGGDTEWVSCALGKENMAGAHCNHCNRTTKDFHLGRGELWTLATLAAMARRFRDEILPGAANRKNKPTGHNGVKHPSMFCIPVHLWVSPILHGELGLVKDWLTRIEKFCDTRIETLPDEEVENRELLIILGDMLEELLMEQEDLSPKETIKEYEMLLKRTNAEIKKRDARFRHEITQEWITVPGRVTPEEQQLVEKLSWDIESCKEHEAELRNEIKETKGMIEKKKRGLEDLRIGRDCVAESGEHAIDLVLSNNGVDRNVYHGKCLIGPHIQKLLDRRVKILEKMKAEFLSVRARTIEKHPGADCASIQEIAEEMAFFSEVLHCYDICFALLRRTKKIFTLEEISELQLAIDKLKILWPTQRSWEEKEASVTPKSHNLWFEVIPQLLYLGRFFHFMEDPIELLHKLDKLTDTVCCHIRNYQFREECKQKQEATARHVEVRQQIQQVNQDRKRKFTDATIAKRENKAVDAIAIKKERRSS
jgi:hypothetical protein